MTTNTVSEVSTNINPNVLYLGEKFDLVISSVAQKMGVATEYFWPALLKQQVVEGACQAAGLLVAIITLSVSLFMLNRMVKAATDANDKCCPVVCFAISSIVSGVGFIVGIVHLSTIINKIINPEAMVLLDFVSKLQ
jgi:hypothetical protein